MTTDWDHSYTHDFSEEWEEEPLIEHRRADVCPLCHLRPCVPWCYNARDVPPPVYISEAKEKERGSGD